MRTRPALCVGALLLAAALCGQAALSGPLTREDGQLATDVASLNSPSFPLLAALPLLGLAALVALRARGL